MIVFKTYFFCKFKVNTGLELCLAVCKKNICPNSNVPMKQLNAIQYVKYCVLFKLKENLFKSLDSFTATVCEVRQTVFEEGAQWGNAHLYFCVSHAVSFFSHCPFFTSLKSLFGHVLASREKSLKSRLLFHFGSFFFHCLKLLEIVILVINRT